MLRPPLYVSPGTKRLEKIAETNLRIANISSRGEVCQGLLENSLKTSN